MIGSAARTKRKHFVHREALVPRTERTDAQLLCRHRRAREIGGALGTLGGHNYPLPGNGIFSKFRQSGLGLLDFIHFDQWELKANRELHQVHSLAKNLSDDGDHVFYARIMRKRLGKLLNRIAIGN